MNVEPVGSIILRALQGFCRSTAPDLIFWPVSLQSDRSHIFAGKDGSQEGSQECFSFRFHGPRGHESHTAHNWLFKTSAQVRKRKTVKLVQRGRERGFPSVILRKLSFQIVTSSSGLRLESGQRVSQAMFSLHWMNMENTFRLLIHSGP